MKVVGITGRSGCGKSSATNFLREKGYPCIDADLVAREVLLPGSPCIAQLQQVFGADIADENGTLRRRLLDMGLTPKTQVTVQKVAPMGDPIELYLRGYVLTIRAEDAAKIEIEEDSVQ